jgi:hypothetical protein
MNEIVTKPENGLPFHFLFLANRQNKKPNLNNNTQKRPYPSPKATNKSENGIKRSRTKKKKNKTAHTCGR